jgi:NADH-quinone oxidoreductase subunit F
MNKFLLKNIDNPNSADIGEYEKTGGYSNLRKALSVTPDDILAEVEKSQLLGRGGGGFPVSMKWKFTATDAKFPKYLISNADEGEPGTFKDRVLLERNPHLLIEGMAISAHALNAGHGFIYLRAEYCKAYKVLDTAIRQAQDRGYLGENILKSGLDFNITVHRSAGAYICGEETALIESLEGKRGNPRFKPPFPVSCGYLSKPTVVNNVETLANIPLIIERGGKAYSEIGSPESPGPKLYCIAGHVERPGILELPMGTTLREIIYDHAGGIKGGQTLKGVIPGGLSSAILTPEEIGCPMDFDSMSRHGSILGTGAVLVFDETTCMVRVCCRAMKFYEHESCGKCTPCREGTAWLRAILERIEKGKGKEDDIELLEDIADNIMGKTFCPLGDGAAFVLLKFIEKFRDEFHEHIEKKGCPLQ